MRSCVFNLNRPLTRQLLSEWSPTNGLGVRYSLEVSFRCCSRYRTWARCGVAHGVSLCGPCTQCHIQMLIFFIHLLSSFYSTNRLSVCCMVWIVGANFPYLTIEEVATSPTDAEAQWRMIITSHCGSGGTEELTLTELPTHAYACFPPGR